MNKNFFAIILLVFFLGLFIPVYAEEVEDSFTIINKDAEEVFTVNDNGDVAVKSVLLTNGATYWGSAPFVLGQDKLNRGIVITDKAASNQKNIYFGWNAGETHDYAELFALQENVAWMNLVLAPNGGNIGIGTKSPLHPLHIGSGAYCSAGGVWTNASSRKYKTDINLLTKDEAMDAFDKLSPVKFRYKTGSEEKHVGFIAEDAPDLVATKDRKGMSSMDVVAVLTKVVQEQQKTISNLSKEMAELKKELRSKEASTLVKVCSGD